MDFRQRLKRGVGFLLLASFSLYFFTAISYGFGHGKYLWKIVLPISLIALLLLWKEYKWKALIKECEPWFPLLFSSLVIFAVYGTWPAGRSLEAVGITLLAITILSQLKLISLRYFYWVNALTCVLLFSSGLIDVLVLGKHVPGETINQNIFAGVAVTVSGFSLISSFDRSINLRSFERKFFACAGILALAITIATQCRTVLLPIALLLLLVWNGSVKSLGKGSAIALIALSLSFLSIVIYFNPGLVVKLYKIIPEISEWLSSNNVAQSSIGIRLEMYSFALTEVFPSHPFIGLGISDGSSVAAMFGDVRINEEFVRHWAHFHNDAIQMLVSGGLLQCVAAISTCFLLWRRSGKNVLILWLLACGILFGLTEIFFFRRNTFVCFLTLYYVTLFGTRFNEVNAKQ